MSLRATRLGVSGRESFNERIAEVIEHELHGWPWAERVMCIFPSILMTLT